MNYLKTLWGNYRTWKEFQKFPESFKPLKKWPSETYMKYPPFENFGGRKVVNFGCGTSVFSSPNVTNIDCVPGEHITVVPADQTQLPFDDNTVDFILANHVMEHLPNWFETMKEFARILKPGGLIEIWIPPISSDSAFSYRDHLNRIGLDSFAGCKSYSRSGVNVLAAEEFKKVGDFAKLKLIWRGYRTHMNWWILLAPECLSRWMVEHLRNIASEEGFKFIKGE